MPAAAASFTYWAAILPFRMIFSPFTIRFMSLAITSFSSTVLLSFLMFASSMISWFSMPLPPLMTIAA